MDITAFPPVAALLDAASAALGALGAAVTAPLAIVLVTLAIRALLIPLGRLQLRAELTRRRLAPQLRELQRRHAKRPEVLQRKTLELYRRERTSPFAGMGPALAQAPVLSLLYGVFTLPTIGGEPNALLHETLLGVPLGDSLAHLVQTGAWADAGVVAMLLVVIGTTAWLSRRTMLRLAARDAATTPSGARPGARPGAQADRQAELGASILRVTSWLPFVTVVIGAIVPVAATLYLATTTTWTLVERAVLRRLMDPPTASAVPAPA
jgi:YidC/Oxa1 family membrane protein insertase